VGEAFGWLGLRIEAAVTVGTASCSAVAETEAATFTTVAGTEVAVVAGIGAFMAVAVVVDGIKAFTVAAVDFRTHLALCGFGSAVGWAQISNLLDSAPAHCKSPLFSPDS